MSDPTFGLSITRLAEDIATPIWADMSIVGLIGTAATGAATLFPANTPVAMYSNDATMLIALGNTGTLGDAVRLLNAQLGEFQSAAKIVVIRVEAGEDAEETIGNIVGNGTTTGLAAFLDAPAITGWTPRLIGAPGFTSQREGEDANAVCAALPPILNQLLAHAVVDGPATTGQAAKEWRETIASERIIPVDPAARISVSGSPVVVPLSPAILGLAVRRDHEFSGRPFHSWANQSIYGIIGPSRPIRFSLTVGATEGQDLLTSNIGILIRAEMGVDGSIADGGFVYIGTDNCGADELWRFYNVTRGRDYIHLMLLKTLRSFLGRFNITGQTVQAIINTMNEALAILKADGDILGYKVEFSADQNAASEIRNGRLVVNFAAEEAPVLRYIGIQSARYRAAVDELISDLATA